MCEINKRIKDLRENYLNLSQDDFAKSLNLQRNTISLIENGKRNPSDRTLLDICRQFSINEIWLRTGEGDMFVELDREDELAAWAGKLLHPDNDGSFQQRFVHMLSKLDIEDWKVLEKMAILMADENKKD